MSESQLVKKDSPLVRVKFKFGKEKISYNLIEEVEFNEDNLTEALVEQPSKYSFLLMVRVRLQRKLTDAIATKDRAYNKTYEKYKRKMNPTSNKAYTNDDARVKAELSTDYLNAQRELAEVQENLSLIDSSIRAMEQRASILQTISANRRKERE